MPINRNTIVRYKTIDRMLRGGRMATLDELIDACQDAIDRTIGFGSVSRRTIHTHETATPKPEGGETE